MSSPITTHVLDTALGRPAQGVRITLEFLDGESFREVGEGTTNDDGRVTDLLDGELERGTYRITFHVGEYFDDKGRATFYPTVPVMFAIEATDEHYHVPLLLNPYGYSTYRGSSCTFDFMITKVRVSSERSFGR